MQNRLWNVRTEFCEVPFEDPEEIVEDETEEEDLGLDPEVEDMYEGKTTKIFMNFVKNLILM